MRAAVKTTRKANSGMLTHRRMLAAALAVSLTWQTDERVTFNQDIAPIILSRCAPCHRPGEIGPFSLLTYRDVRQRLTQIRIATERRIMPPWKPVPGGGEFDGERRLTNRELELIQRWIADGAPEGAPRAGCFRRRPAWSPA